MKIYVLKKSEHRKYSSDDLLWKVFSSEGLTAFEMKKEKRGKPYLVSSLNMIPFHISVSHTSNYWVCALSPIGAVGIDIEERSRVLHKNISKKLHPLEQRYLSLFPENSREWLDEFLHIWTRKESYIKFTGNGLSEGLSSFSVIDEDNEYVSTMTSRKGELLHIKNIFLKPELVSSICTQEALSSFLVLDLFDEGAPVKPALEQASDFLAVRDYPSNALIKKLKERGHSFEEAQTAVKELIERGYVDDNAFTKRFIDASLQKGKGRLRVEKELIDKGVNPLTAKEMTFQMVDQSEQSEAERAFAQAKKLLAALSDSETCQERECLTEKQLGKIARRLAALGYESSAIYEVIAMLRR
ncbi:MAG: 4'-phosphopantetheinyl transferase superfamily protein [Clostridia bacterium]|nr:4'-phosphopantetheinyl transferase superfamily protein [Clostridia bacterium]